MGVNIGSYGYQNGRGNLLQQLNYSNAHGGNTNANDARVEEEIRRRRRERQADEEDQEDEENDEVNELL